MSDNQSAEQALDLVIAGGGMAGSLLAYVLLSQNPGLKLAIVEQSPELGKDEQPSKASFDSRSIALAHGSVELLQQWGLWQELQQSGCAIKHIQISDRGHFGKTYLNAADYQLFALGQVIEVEAIGEVLWQKLKHFTTQGRLSWFYKDAISALHPTTELQRISLKSGAQLRAKLLVIAEGGLSPSRTLAGFELKSDDYQQHALIANIGLADSHQHKAFERFTPTGPLALLPLTRQRYSLVWTLTPEQAELHLHQADNEFLAALQQAAGHRAGVFKSVGQRVVYPLSLKRATEAARHRTVLLGNSLHNLHPIAGQGFNLAIRDIFSLSLLLQKHQTDVGWYQLTKAYQQARLPDMQQVILYTDSLVRLFSNSSRLMALGRNTGLFALNLCPDLKQVVANQAMGLNSIRQLKAQLS
ncbi:2-polyprenyl-6-methoxyphenol hydroxylase [Rheinheimera sp. KL1]|uniref:2-octaprenyl-6-methoxyphenyl hydroxylase n=1 Tax=Rheinheimera sp. KL1 TaxID=1635005 RepID=UPI0006A9DCA3|nr:2-octaprenyl-6-methoxyphenyl hydroxylase [Rheinheimera sp. KL1]KOO57492.1 2-polyprenyl-6-methoxyphenol hydroxylase [Rheinheimera sp. KL1]